MSAIGPGDWVQKVGDSICMPSLKHGTLARVAGIGGKGGCISCNTKGRGIIIPEWSSPLQAISPRNRPWANGWCTCAWRLVYRPKPDAFTDLLKVPDKAKETA